MPKKQDPHNEKRYTLKPLTTKAALKRAMQAGNGGGKPKSSKPKSKSG